MIPKISVVVPIYNVEEYLRRCIDSLIGQTLQEIQIILVNDGSTDESSKIAKQYANDFPEKILYLEKTNGGLSDARNCGMLYAEGEYIAFLDSDDYIEKDAYEKMYNKAVKENADYVECNFIWEYPDKIKIDKRYPYSTKKEMLAFIRVAAWNKLLKRDIIEKNNIKFPKGLRYEDVEFIYKLIPYINKFTYVDEEFIHYIQRKDSITNVQNVRTAEIFQILDNVIDYYKEKKIYDEYKEELEYIYTRYLLCSSLKRICQIPDKEERNRLLKKTWYNLNNKFPHWKKNKILRNDKSMKSKYMKTVNKLTYKVYTNIFFTKFK